VKILSLQFLVLVAHGITSLICITLQVQCLWPSMRPLAQACMLQQESESIEVILCKFNLAMNLHG